MRTQTLWAGTLAVTLVLAACGDGMGPGENEMTEAEREAVASGMSGSSYDGAQSGGSSSSSLVSSAVVAAATDTVTITFDHTESCPAGGQVEMTGESTVTYDSGTGSYALDLNGNQTHRDCAFVAEQEDSTTITVNGDPNITFTLQVSKSDTTAKNDINMALDGAFDWSTDDGREGSCEVHMSVTGSGGDTEQTMVLEGEVCEETIRHEITRTTSG